MNTSLKELYNYDGGKLCFGIAILCLTMLFAIFGIVFLLSSFFIE